MLLFRLLYCRESLQCCCPHIVACYPHCRCFRKTHFSSETLSLQSQLWPRTFTWFPDGWGLGSNIEWPLRYIWNALNNKSRMACVISWNIQLSEPIMAVLLSRSHFLPLRDDHPGRRFWHSNLKLIIGCPPSRSHFLPWEITTREGVSGTQLSSKLWLPTFKEPFLSLERSPPREVFLALNYQADYGCPLKSYSSENFAGVRLIMWFKLLALGTSEGPGSSGPRTVGGMGAYQVWDHHSHTHYDPKTLTPGTVMGHRSI